MGEGDAFVEDFLQRISGHSSRASCLRQIEFDRNETLSGGLMKLQRDSFSFFILKVEEPC